MVPKLPKIPLNHAAGIYADISVDGPEIGTLVAVIDRAKNLPNRKTMGKQNPYCAARLGKEAKKTETDMRGGQTPRWDQELRFSVHESGDYFRLKVSVFNDDKKTDLIGETWVELNSVIVAGGGQGDHWHPLQCRGRYAGEIRIEMTYYDTRPKDEVMLERKREAAAERIQAKANLNNGNTSSSLAGPRKSKDVKRRPVPLDNNATPAMRPATADKAQPVPRPAQPPPPTRHGQVVPPAVPPGHVRHPPKNPPAEDQYAAPVYNTPYVPRPVATHDNPDDVPREWEAVSIPSHAQAAEPRRLQQGNQQHYHSEPPVEMYDPRFRQAMPQPEYEERLRQDYQLEQKLLPNSPDRHPDSVDTYPGNAYHSMSPASNHSVGTNRHIVDYPAPSRGHPGHTYAPPSSDPACLSNGSEPVQSSGHYRPLSNSSVKSNRPVLQYSVSREGHHPHYAAMQPKVEDGEDYLEEEAPPPPPPVHKSGMAHTMQRREPAQLPSSYKDPYPSEYPSSAPPPAEMKRPVSGGLSSPGRFDDLPPYSDGPSVPPSLIAGYDPTIAEAESDRAVYENQVSRKRSGLLTEQRPASQHSLVGAPPPSDRFAYENQVSRKRSGLMTEQRPSSQHSAVIPPPQPTQPPSYDTLIQPLRIASKQIDRPGVAREGSGSSGGSGRDINGVPMRKSVSPKPPPTEERGLMTIPFSPDSYEALNPNAARSAVLQEPLPSYETPKQAMDAAFRTENHPDREVGPIIGDDGREIDPSDHLPTDTWAPEPEKKNRKPEVIVRFKHPSSRTSPHPSPSQSDNGTSRAMVPTASTDLRRPRSYVHFSTDIADRTPRGREGPTPSNYSRYGAPAPETPPRTHQHSSVSPAGSFSSMRSSYSPSSLYEPINPGPPIPAKVPIAAPIQHGHPSTMNRSMDALSKELNSIDIGSVGCYSGRPARRYARPVTTGYVV